MFTGEYSRNALKELRQASLFETFKPRHNSQQLVWQTLQHLSEQVIGAAPHIEENEYPFEVGNIILLRGTTGLGKSHLAEAFLNRLLQRCPGLAKKMAVCQGRDFRTSYCSSTRPFGKASIVLIDDIFAGESTNYENNPCTVEWFGKFILDVYDHRQLVIVTSNIPIFTKGGVMDHMAAKDPVGRVKSRLAEIVVNDYEIKGNDYREILGRRRKPATRLRVGPPNKTILPTQDELFPPSVRDQKIDFPMKYPQRAISGHGRMIMVSDFDHLNGDS